LAAAARWRGAPVRTYSLPNWPVMWSAAWLLAMSLIRVESVRM
jgi:hypothetical protein